MQPQSLSRRRLVQGAAGAAASVLHINPNSALATSQATPENLADTQELRMAAIDTANPYDPHLSYVLNTKGRITFFVWAGLVKLDENLQVVPDIAHSWDVSDDVMTYTFHIDPDRKFSDGTSITANDVAWSWIRSLSPETESIVAGGYLGNIAGAQEYWRGQTDEPPEGIRVLDDLTLEVQLTAPANYFAEILIHPASFVVKQSDVERGTPDQPWYMTAEAFSGPYAIESYTPQARLELQRNPHYPVPHTVERIAYTFVESAQTQLLLYQNDEVDLTEIEITDADHILNDDPTYRDELIEQPLWWLVPLYMRMELPPFDEEPVRRAFSMAVDKQVLIGTVLRDLNEHIDGVYYPELNVHNPDLDGIPFDPEGAQTALSESSYGGVENLPSLRFWTTEGALGTESRVAATLQEMWRQNLGVENMEIRIVASGTEVRESDAQITLGGEGLHYPHANGALGYLTCDSGANSSQHCDEDWDNLVNQAASTLDQEESVELYQEAERQLIEKAALFPLYRRVAFFLAKPHLRNLKTTPMYTFPDFDQVYIEQH